MEPRTMKASETNPVATEICVPSPAQLQGSHRKVFTFRLILSHGLCNTDEENKHLTCQFRLSY